MNSKRLRQAAVIGSPVSHSLSPAIFQFLSEHEDMPLEYKARELDESELSEFFAEMRADSSQVGVNVTLPLKEKVFPFLDELSNEASALGAVNVIHHDGARLRGFNTDVIGIDQTLNLKNKILEGKTVLLLGAGGSAKAVAWVLGQKKTKQVFIYNPRSNRAEDLIRHFKPLFPKTEFRSLSSLDEIQEVSLSLAVNSTPVGMSVHDNDSFFLGLKRLRFESDALAFDLIYTPEETAFLKVARELNLDAIGGLSMLIEQALATFEIWMGPLRNSRLSAVELSSYLRGILAMRRDSSPIFLTGFMGVGKTTVARALSKVTRRAWIDTDHHVESEAKLSIPEIFEKQGEKEFRRLETQSIQTLSKLKNQVIALGGGALMNEENLKTILASGTLVYLKVSEPVLNERLSRQKQNRPLMAGLSEAERAKKIKDLLALRVPVYERSHITVDAEGSERRVAQAIISKMGERR